MCVGTGMDGMKIMVPFDQTVAPVTEEAIVWKHWYFEPLPWCCVCSGDRSRRMQRVIDFCR